MEDVLLLPGVWFNAVDNTVAYCPACGLKAMRLEVSLDSVQVWFASVDFMIRQMGFNVEIDDREKAAMRFMNTWTHASKVSHGYPWGVM